MNRRDVLKFFGAGALISPAASAISAARVEVPPVARIVEPPKIELVDAGVLIGRSQQFDVTVSIPDGGSYKFKAFACEFHSPHVEVTTHEDQFRQFVPSGDPYRVAFSVLPGTVEMHTTIKPESSSCGYHLGPDPKVNR